MKLIIYTQHEENYGAHDWDGQGTCPQYWKPKGGEIYVVRHVSERNAERIEKNGIPTLTALLTQRNDSFRESINGWGVFEDTAPECEDWESPIYLTYNTIAGAWRAERRIKNTADHCLHQGIEQKIQRWFLSDQGPSNYRCYYLLTNGKYCTAEDLPQELQRLADQSLDNINKNLARITAQ